MELFLAFLYMEIHTKNKIGFYASGFASASDIPDVIGSRQIELFNLRF
jgi:hypothetical protein